MKQWTIKTSPIVRADLSSIAAYYRAVAPEQVPAFHARYREAISMIRTWPNISAEDRPNIHHYKMPVFPYNIFYSTDTEAKLITILAVLHQRRDPAVAARRTTEH